MRRAPDHWTSTTVGEVTLPVDKHRPEDEPTYEFPYVDISSIDNGTNKVVEPKLVLGRDAPSRARQIVRAGDTVLSTVRTYLKNTAIVPADLDGATASTGFSVLRPDSDRVDPRFLFYRVLEQGFVEKLSEKQTGTSYPAVRDRDVRAMAFCYPPLPEQRQIVDAIEEQFSRLDAGVGSLRRAKRNLARLRTSVLQSATQGGLVATLPEDKPATKLMADVGIEPLRSGPAELPPSWAWASLGSILREGLSNGRSVPTRDDGFPVLRLTCLKEGRVDLAERKGGDWGQDEASPFLVEKGDFLVSRGNGSLRLVGRGGLIDQTPDPIAYPDTLIRVRPRVDLLVPSLLAFWWDAPLVRRQLEPQARTTAGIYKINQSIIGRVVLPIPPASTQTRIVDELNRQLTLIKAMTAAVETAARRSASLGRSVLSSAFAGQIKIALVRSTEVRPA